MLAIILDIEQPITSPKVELQKDLVEVLADKSQRDGFPFEENPSQANFHDLINEKRILKKYEPEINVWYL